MSRRDRPHPSTEPCDPSMKMPAKTSPCLARHGGNVHRVFLRASFRTTSDEEGVREFTLGGLRTPT